MENKYGKPLWVIGHKLIATETMGDYGFAEVEVTPGVPGPPPHYHQKASELYYVLDGTVDILRDDEWHTLKKGDSLKIPRGTVHSFRNESGEPARFITIHDPGAGMDFLFLTYSIPANEAGGFEESISEEMISGFAAAAADNDMIIVEQEPA